MPRAVLMVEQAGPLTTLQDAGRFGHLRHGVTWSGPVDRLGQDAAHAALGNPPGSTAVELSHGGIALSCIEGAVGFALAGGDFHARLGSVMLGSWTTGVVRAGERLVVRDGKLGNWASLAFAGRIQCPAWLGSTATLALASLGGGRVKAGDRLVIDADAGAPDSRPIPRPPAVTGPIRLVSGPQAGDFAPESLTALLAMPFAAAAFDRMGMVLDGPPLPPLSVTMLSAPLLRGAVQVNGAGTATILLADHQTTAGYPRIATIISADVSRAAQHRPGEEMRFAAVDVAQAIAVTRTTAAVTADYIARVGAGQGSLEDRLMQANLIDGVTDAHG